MKRLHMLFHTFDSQEERSIYGGSAFIEIQYCNMPLQTTIKELVAVGNIQHWKNDSLYVHMDDDHIFYQAYGHVFDCGTYNNLKRGIVDLYGINYYAPTLIESIVEKLNTAKPEDYEILVAWLAKAKSCNGFYILGA